MSSSDCFPDHPLSSDLVRRLKSALDARDEETVRAVICTQVRHVDAVIELANDDWMKDPSAQLPPGVLLGNQSPVLETIPITCACDMTQVGHSRSWEGGRLKKQMTVFGCVILTSLHAHVQHRLWVSTCDAGNR